MDLRISDPTAAAPSRWRWLDATSERLVTDARDVPFVRLALGLTLLMPPVAVYLFLPGRFRWWIAVPYLALFLYYLGPYTLMLHNTSHRRLFKRRYERLNGWIPSLLGPFFGQSPQTYFAHHIGMHHPENNLPNDLSSTMRFQRDSAVDFLRYFGRFFAFGLVELCTYFARRRRYALLRKALLGELGFYVLAALLCWINWRAALTVVVIPLVVTRFVMMAGNWAQHAFIDARTPESCYRNSITCINSVYNRRCFNDGYHIGHHLQATRHWTEMPGELLSNVGQYAAERALVFEGTDFFAVWALLMAKRYRALAKHLVSIDGTPRSLEEAVELLRNRTRPIDAPAESLDPLAA